MQVFNYFFYCFQEQLTEAKQMENEIFALKQVRQYSCLLCREFEAILISIPFPKIGTILKP